jgi:ribokinase
MNRKEHAIVVVGSSNTDMVVKTERIPRPGETILGGNFFMNPGGKGANQAVAAARLGSPVHFVANLGDDIFGHEALKQFTQEGINTRFVSLDPLHPSGVALITVDERGENNIVVASGANAAMTVDMIDKARDVIENASVLLVQLEVPLEVVQHAGSLAAAKGVTVILNPAPAQDLPPAVLKVISILTPNETEASLLSGIDVRDPATALQAAKRLCEAGIATVVITLGEQGALLYNKEVKTLIPAPAVHAVDTTAAGDVFNGALAAALANGKSMVEAVTFGCQAAALSVTRLGAQSSAPYLSELHPLAAT